MASQCGCKSEIPLLYDTLVGLKTILRDMNGHLEYLVIVADELKELKDEQMRGIRSCDCCHLHGTPGCGHHDDDTRSAEPSPADAGSHEHSMRCFQEPGHCPDEVKREPPMPLETGSHYHDECTDECDGRICECVPRPPKAKSAAAQREGGLCTLCNDGGWKGETHFERAGKHTKASP